jgi:hypothetical protein
MTIPYKACTTMWWFGDFGISDSPVGRRCLRFRTMVPPLDISTTSDLGVSVCCFTLPDSQPRPRPSIFIYIFLIFSAFSHEKTGTRWFGSGAEEGRKPNGSEKIEGWVDFPTTRPKLPWNCPGCEMPNYCVLKQNYLPLNSEFKPIQIK